MSSAALEAPSEPLVYAGMLRRALAFLADCATLPLFAATVAGATPSGRNVTAQGRLTLVLWLAYIIVSLRLFGTTLGKRAFNIEIRSSRPGGMPTICELTMRETVFRWLSLICFL